VAKKKKHKKAAVEHIRPKPRQETLSPPPVKKGVQPTTTIPGSPGVPTPTPSPFWTPDDLLAINEYQTQESSQLAELDAMLANARVNRDYELSQADDRHKHNIQAATEDMIGRGLFASSVKDSALYDLEATLGLQRTFLNDRFNQVANEAASKKDVLLGSGGARQRFWSAMQQKAAQNASELAASQGPWQVEPTPAQTVPNPITSQPRQGPKGQPGSIQQIPRQPFSVPNNMASFVKRPKQATIKRNNKRAAQDRLVQG
jgi:hypothetical protein